MNKKGLCKLVASLLAVIFMANINAANIVGKIKLTTFEQSSKCDIEINSVKVACSKNGIYRVEVPNSAIYSVKINSKGYYPAFQSFSHFELSQMAESGKINQFTIPDIFLVRKKANRVMFAFGGDVMMGRRFAKPYFDDPVLIREDSKLQDTKALVQYIKPYMELADFSAVNLETQISEKKPAKRAPKGVTFYSPPETLEALKWAGIDYVTLGNNHIYDYLDEGLISTLDFLNASHLGYSGAGIDQIQALKPYYANISGQNYAMLGFVGWAGGFTPNQVADSQKGGSALGTEENIAQSVSALIDKGQPTIVQYHGSLEYSDEPTAMTESRLKMAIDKGADLVIAHHPHVTQGFEIYKGKLIAYSMGNFIFDQYFHASPHSYILYVWMDGEKLHRAEIVPIYLKGYVPVPATGMQRNTLLKRTANLTNNRGLTMATSGGHLILQDSRAKKLESTEILVFDTFSRVKNIYDFPVKRIVAVQTGSKGIRYRLGENQINGGDFETFELFTSNERGWLLSHAKLSERQAYSGKKSVAVSINQQDSSLVGMQTFRRVFKAGNPVSYVAKILNTDKPVKVKLLFQKRKTKDKFFDALEKNKKQIIKELVINPQKTWQNIEIDFNLPRVGYKSYRVLLEISGLSEPNKEAGQVVYLDDIELINWQAHYNESNELPAKQSLTFSATHIGLETNSNKQRKVTLKLSH